MKHVPTFKKDIFDKILRFFSSIYSLEIAQGYVRLTNIYLSKCGGGRGTLTPPPL